MMYELPPQAAGTPEQQIAALRDYLVRLAMDLDRAGGSDVHVTEIAGRAQKNAVEAVRDQATALKSLIVKSANELAEKTDARFESFSSAYVAVSDYGNYYEQIDAKVRQSARETVESYQYASAIDALEKYALALNGQIRRGLIREPGTDRVHLGIAISEKLSFTGGAQTQGGETYYELSPGQTLGLYTSTGWQFWINGQLMGWFSSEDSMLHVGNLFVENRQQFGADWQITADGGFGLRYIGA